MSELCARLQAPERLIAHLTLVHDVACQITTGLDSLFPSLSINSVIVKMGAAVHDIGKVIHPEELTASGSLHEVAGQPLLMEQGFSDEIACCARSHGRWFTPQLSLEELLVALADTVWKGTRSEPLELKIVDLISRRLNRPKWQVFDGVDCLLDRITKVAESRLAWQASPCPTDRQACA